MHPPYTDRLGVDLQGLTIALKPIEPICTPTEYKLVNVSSPGRLHLSDSAIPRTPIVLEGHYHYGKLTGKDRLNVLAHSEIATTSRKPLPCNRTKEHKRKDSFALIMDEGMDEMRSSNVITAGVNNPPSVDEMKRIAEDIKNGLY
jgi:hypothetical protein